MLVTVDPGNVSGVALYAPGMSSVPLSYEVPYDDFSRFFWELLEGSEPGTHVVMERYVMSTSRIITPQPQALMTMGQAEMACSRFGVRWSYYLPQVNKRSCPDEMLRKLGWYRRTPDGHANDGMRLIITHLKSRHPEEFAALLGL